MSQGYERLLARFEALSALMQLPEIHRAHCTCGHECEVTDLLGLHVQTGGIVGTCPACGNEVAHGAQ